MNDIVRVIRVMEYTGSREDVERTLLRGQVPANGSKVVRSMTINSRIMEDFPEVLPWTSLPKEDEK